MHGTYVIEVGYKKGVTDPLARSLQEDVRHLGLTSVKDAGTAQLYRLIGDLTPAHRTRVAEGLLCDSILQEYRDGAVPSPALRAPSPRGRGHTTLAFSLQGEGSAASGSPHDRGQPLQAVGRGGRRPDEGALVVDVWYKSGVTDVVGESVAKGIRDLGCNTVSEVRTGMRYRFWGLKGLEAGRKIATALLANPLVHDHNVHAD